MQASDNPRRLWSMGPRLIEPDGGVHLSALRLCVSEDI